MIRFDVRSLFYLTITVCHFQFSGVVQCIAYIFKQSHTQQVHYVRQPVSVTHVSHHEAETGYLTL